MAEVTPLPVVWDMETQDPDDFLTLLFLLGHPGVHLKGVTITPGAPAQVGLVRWALAQFERDDVEVGAYNLDHPKDCVSAFHWRGYGHPPPSRDARPGWEVLRDHWSVDTTLITGAPLKNLGVLLRNVDDRAFGHWVCQGGFAGVGVVPDHLQLPKFRGLRTCPTFNLNGDPKAALAALASPQIQSRRLVSKNVCHGVVYDRALHELFTEERHRRKSLELIWQGMEAYLQRKDQKALHDPLAACCAIDPSIATWADVEVFREKGKWGSRLAEGTNTRIIVELDEARFHDVLLT